MMYQLTRVGEAKVRDIDNPTDSFQTIAVVMSERNNIPMTVPELRVALYEAGAGQVREKTIEKVLRKMVNKGWAEATESEESAAPVQRVPTSRPLPNLEAPQRRDVGLSVARSVVGAAKSTFRGLGKAIRFVATPGNLDRAIVGDEHMLLYGKRHPRFRRLRRDQEEVLRGRRS